MESLIIVEMVTAIIFFGLAMITGYHGNKVIGAVTFGLVAVLFSVLFVAGTIIADGLFIDEVGNWIGTLAEAAFILLGMAMLLGYSGNKVIGAVLLSFGAILVSALCIAGVLAGYTVGENSGAWLGLLAGILLAGIVMARFLGGVIRGRSGRFLTGTWFGYCALCVSGYLAGGWMGFLTITLPAIVLFWVGLLRISAYILPLRDKRDRSQRRKAFRSLITSSMGTNYPYHFVDENGRLDERVKGNPFLRFFAGPGVVHTGPDQAAYVTDGVFRNRVFEPGLSFTGLFDLPPRIIDLRPQLRAFDVEALTKDGIPIKVLTFIPFQIESGSQAVQLGHSFPFRPRAIYEVVARELVEKGGVKHEWDGQLVPAIATRVIQDIIGRYNVDELCASLDPDRDPRDEIVREMTRRVQDALRPYGIRLLGVGISNLDPQDSEVIERRLDSWRTKWMRQILLLMGEGEAERVRQMELAQAEAEVEIVLRLSRIVEESMRSGDVSQALALRFIDSLGEIVCEAGAYGAVPEGVDKTLKRLRGEIEETQE